MIPGIMHAMPLLIGILCILAIAYRYYSAFLAARVAVLDDRRLTPAVRLNDGQNFHPTNRWVLFGHHFAAISGAGPLIGPVLAAQFGYLPGLLWIVIGVCLAGAMQDFLVLAASMHRNGKSLAQMAYDEIGKTAGIAAMAAILFIIVIALAGLGKVVVNALGGDSVAMPAGSVLVLPDGTQPVDVTSQQGTLHVPAGATLIFNGGKSQTQSTEAYDLALNGKAVSTAGGISLPAKAVRIIPGSSWGTFTIACTIPIALFIGFYMYRIRKGKVIEASLIGAALTLGATVLGGWVAQSQLAHYFNLSASAVVWTMAIYGFVASILPVWLLLCPRDYLSSFLKIGTLAGLVIGVIVANPSLQAPAYNSVFAGGGPQVAGKIFPFLFITIMCGAVSGFHALVSSGTTPKMISRESDARMIGYGAMLIEGLVGAIAMIAAACLPVGDYYAINTDMTKAPAYHDKFVLIGADVDHLNVMDSNTQESLRGRPGGAATLAVGFASIFENAIEKVAKPGAATVQALWKYWYHFAIMFEALFILTTIDTGTRIGRFLLQEIFGLVNEKLGRKDWWPGAIVSTGLIVAAWAYFINSNSFSAIWSMFGVANQMLVVVALAVVTAILANENRLNYAMVTVLPMAFVAITTTTAALELFNGHWLSITTQLNNPSPDQATLTRAIISASLIAAMLISSYIVVGCAALRIWPALWHTSQPALAAEPGI